MSDAFPGQARIVVIGGGIVGASVAYHLARDHRCETLLLERHRLTSGSTWHAAGLVGQLRSSAAVTQLLRASVALYERLEAETGQATGWKMTGCLRLATTADRMIEFRRLATTARSFGLAMHLLSPADVKAMWPLMETGDLVGASFLPSDGQANPSDIAQALARGARMHGARLIEETRVEGFDLKGRRVVAVRTDRGAVACDAIVICAGLWSRAIGRLAGVRVPLQAVRHQYIVTEKIDGLAPGLATLRDPDRRTYFKEEVGGLVMGGYEPDPIAWHVEDDPPDDAPFHLFEDDWDHFEPHMQAAVARIPALAQAGVKQMIHGPESFTPDGNFILGRAPERDNVFVGAGFNAFGIASAGGAGAALAHWTIHGEAPSDLSVVDIRRFGGAHDERGFVAARTLEAYGKHYALAFPGEEYESGRPRLVSPLYDRLKARGAVFGSKLGYERANFFARSADEARDVPSMGRPTWFDAVAAEHRAAREKAALFDESSFAKFTLRGPGAADALGRLCANDVAGAVGRVVYTQMLNARGGVECDLTVTRRGAEDFFIVTGTGSRTRDFAWIAERLPAAGCDLADVTDERATLALMGPRARDILGALTKDDVSSAALPFAAMRRVTLAGRAVEALRITYVGELGYELHMANADAGAVFDALFEEGAAHGIAPGGYRAIESLRLEKAYRAWGSDVTPNDTPFEAGLGFAVALREGRDFLGRAALEAARAAPLKKRLCGFLCDEADVTLVGRETILRDGEAVGYLTSGGFGHTLQKPIGYGYVRRAAGVDADWLREGRYELVVAETRVPCALTLAPPYDPKGEKIKA